MAFEKLSGDEMLMIEPTWLEAHIHACYAEIDRLTQLPSTEAKDARREQLRQDVIVQAVLEYEAPGKAKLTFEKAVEALVNENAQDELDDTPPKPQPTLTPASPSVGRPKPEEAHTYSSVFTWAKWCDWQKSRIEELESYCTQLETRLKAQEAGEKG